MTTVRGSVIKVSFFEKQPKAFSTKVKDYPRNPICPKQLFYFEHPHLSAPGSLRLGTPGSLLGTPGSVAGRPWIWALQGVSGVGTLGVSGVGTPGSVWGWALQESPCVSGVGHSLGVDRARRRVPGEENVVNKPSEAHAATDSDGGGARSPRTTWFRV